MNLRVTIEGKVYDLLIETSDEQTAPSSAAMPPLRLGRPASPSSQAVSTAEAAIAAKAARAKAAATEAQAAVLRVRWGAENPDEVPTPISGTVTDILVKIGDTLHINDAVAVVTADSMLAAGSRPFVGTVRSLVGGTVADVLVRPGDRVGLHQSLVRVARKP
jgi:biotin carboxyl carrier protein